MKKIVTKQSPLQLPKEVMPTIMPNPMVMEYTAKHGRREGLLYNNRIFFGYINPSQKRKDEYDVNRSWILANFKK